ncbi:MAG: O-antigen ligase family protein, partial [Thermotogaceae bacterium]|nr:O-antigen ligase family protein [Thermotogaceae bacterium]
MDNFEKFEEVFFSVLYVVVALFAHKKLTYEFSVPKYAMFSLGFTVLLAAAIVYLLKKDRYTIKINLSHILFFGFAVSALLSTINVYRDRPFYFIYSIDIALYTLLNVFVAVYLSNRYNKKDKVIRFMFVMILTAAFISFDALLNFYTGKDIFLGKVGTAFSRASIKATIGNTIFVANYLGMVIPTTLYFILSYSVGITEEKKKKIDIKKEYLKVVLLKSFATISLILMIITVIVSQTRSEYGGVFLTNLIFFILYFMFIYKKKKKNEPREKIESRYPELAKGLSSLQKTLIIFAAVAVIVVLVLYNIPSPLTGYGKFTASKRVEAMFSSGSWEERMLAWFSSIYQWKDHKILGTGIGTYQILTISYMGKIMENHPRFIWSWNNFKRTHNDYFQILGETGIVGAMFIYALLIYLIVYLFRTLKKLEDADNSLLFLAIAMGFADFAIQSFFSFPGHLLPNTVTAIFLASVATSDLFNKDDWMTFKISFKRTSFVATTTIVLILTIISTFMRWNYFISEVHFKAGNSAYVAMIELRKAQAELLDYKKQLEKDIESFYKKEGRFAYLKDLKSFKAYKMKQIGNQFTNLSDANFEKMRLEEIRKWEEKFKQVKEEIQEKYTYASQQEKLYYAKALKELTKCLSMNHAYGKAYFYLAALSVQPERMKELKNSLSSIGDYEKFFKQEFDVFQKFIHPDKKREDLVILHDLMKKKNINNVLDTLGRDNVIV